MVQPLEMELVDSSTSFIQSQDELIGLISDPISVP